MNQEPDVKVASATVYLMEELGDARMRCDQLLRYVDRAVTLVEKSSHKDHLFEVAGDLIRGIPETLFKMHKALEAVALAANRIDYEEIKQDLRPEKVEELERVLKDVRVRQVQRRSQPMVNPPDAVQQLQGLAKKAKEEGQLDTAALSTLIAALEAGKPRKVASSDGVAAQLEAMVHALQNPPQGELPSRQRLAQVLRRLYADHVDVTADVRIAELPHAQNIARVSGLGAKEMKKAADAFNGGQDQLGWLCLHVASGHVSSILHMARQKQTTAQKLAEELLTLADKANVGKTASAEEAKRSRFEEGKPADPTKHMDPEDAKAWKENTDEYGDKFKKEAGKPSEPAQLALNTAIVGIKQMLRGAGSPKRTLHGIVTSLAQAAESLGQDGRITVALQRAAMTINQAFSVADMRDYADGVSVMAGEDESDAISGDRIAKKSMPQFQVGDVVKPDRDQPLPSGGGYDAKGEVVELSDSYERTGWLKVKWPNRPQPMMVSAWGLKLVRRKKSAGEDEKRSRFEEGKPADPTKHMDPEDAKAWKENTDEYGDKFKKEAVDSKAVEAVSANLPLLGRLIDTCEDTAKQLKHSLALVKRDPGRNAPQVDNIAQHVNSLATVLRAVNRKVFDVKTAADTVAADTTASDKTAEVQVPPPEESVIEEIMSWHGGQGSKLYSVGSRWYGGHSVELDSAEEAYDELKRLKANREVLTELKGHLKRFQRKTKKASETAFWKAE